MGDVGAMMQPQPGAQPDAAMAMGAGGMPDQPQQPGPQPQQVSPQVQFLLRLIDLPNIAEVVDQSLLNQIGMRAAEEYQIDLNSRAGWKTKADKALQLAQQENKPKSFPWAGASSVIWPLITTAANEFAARAYPAIVLGKDVVKGSVVGSDKGIPVMMNGKPQMGPAGQPYWIMPPGAKQKRADLIGAHMSWQVLSQMQEWEAQTDQMLHELPIIGCAARKTYYDPALRRNCSVFVSMMDLVVNFKAKSWLTAPRHTEEYELYPYQIEEHIRDGRFVEFNYGIAASREGYGSDRDTPHVFLEQHRFWDLDKDGYPEPYIVTLHKETSRVVRIRARFDAQGIEPDPQDGKILRITPIHYYTLYQFIPNPKSAIYANGFGHLLTPINEAINTTLNQMFDAGTLQNAGGGFIGGTLSMHAGNVRFRVGEYKVVNTMGANIRDSIHTMEFPGPSQVLFSLLGSLIEAGKEIAALKDVVTGKENAASVAPGTLMALIEQGLRMFTDIYKRIWRSLKDEFGKLYDLNAKYLTQSQGFGDAQNWQEITPADYRMGSGVEPVADPTVVTDMQRFARAMFLIGTFKDDPLVNQIELRRRVLEAGQITDIDALLVENPSATPQAQLAQAKALADLGVARAEESQRYAQGILYLTQAKKLAGDADLAMIDKQLSLFDRHLEAIDTQIRAAKLVTEQDRTDAMRERAKAKSANS